MESIPAHIWDLRELLRLAYEAGNQNFAELSDEFVEDLLRRFKVPSPKQDTSLRVFENTPTFTPSMTTTLSGNYSPHYYSYYATQDGAATPSLGEITLWS